MGTQWEIIDLKNRRRFALDKGHWALARLDRGGPLTLADVRDGIRAVLADRYRDADERHVEALAPRVWAFCHVAEWRIELYQDAGDYSDDAMAHWPIVDDRCRGPLTELDPDPCGERTAAALGRCR